MGWWNCSIWLIEKKKEGEEEKLKHLEFFTSKASISLFVGEFSNIFSNIRKSPIAFPEPLCFVYNFSLFIFNGKFTL